MTLHQPNRLLLFGLFALMANICIAVLLRHDHRPVVVAASCVDFVVSLPAIYYFLVIRTGVQPLITIVPVLMAGLFRVAYVAPFSGISRAVMPGICECVVAWFLLRHGRKSRAARILLSELSILRYALGSWGMRPNVPDGGRAFTMHQAGGIGTMFGLFAGISVMEAGVAHLVIQRWSPTAAWVVFGLSIYGALLLVALARSFSLRPIVVTSDRVLIRSGMIWRIEVAADQIAGVEAISGGRDYFRITGMAEPNVFLELRESVEAEGLYGRRRRVCRIGISADQPRELSQAIRSLATAASD